MDLLTMDEVLFNWGERTKMKEQIMHSCISSSSEVFTSLKWDYTPTPQEEIDVGSIGTSTEHYVDLESEISRVPQEVYVSKPITTNEKGARALELRVIGSITERYMHKVLFTETECLVVSSDFRSLMKFQILLKVPRHHNMYSFDMKTPSLIKGFACLIAKATSDESRMWHRRLGHINFKTVIQSYEGNCQWSTSTDFRKTIHVFACIKESKHRASCKAKLERLITKPLHTLHMDLFGPTSVKSINHASYCLVITDDCTRFSWVFFLASKDETSGILQNFIRQIENQLNHRVKIIRSDNGTEFKNRDMLEFYTLSVLGKFDGKCDEGFLVGYSLNSKAYRVYNLVTKRVEVNLHVNFLEEKPNVKGVGYRWMFDIDYLTDSINYIPISLENQANPHVGTSEVTNNASILEVTNSAGILQTPYVQALEEEDEASELIVVPITVKYTAYKVGTRKHSAGSKEAEWAVPAHNTTSTPSVNTGSGSVNTGGGSVNTGKILLKLPYDEEGVVHDFNNLPTEVAVSPIPTLRIHNIHPQSQILGDPKSIVQTRSKVKIHTGAHALVSYIQAQQRNNHKDQQHCLFACFLSQDEPKKVFEALDDGS
ncbi:putative ribonuclease H-like domain-containing protein [Tanacetum coccineum]